MSIKLLASNKHQKRKAKTKTKRKLILKEMPFYFRLQGWKSSDTHVGRPCRLDVAIRYRVRRRYRFYSLFLSFYDSLVKFKYIANIQSYKHLVHVGLLVRFIIEAWINISI